MSSSSSLPQPVGPLSVGNVVSASLRLYRDHFKPYLGVAFRASLWSIFPFVILFPLVLMGFLLSNGGENTPVFVLLMVLLLPFWLFFLIYCTAKSLTNAAIISRMAFSVLTNKPETVTQTRQQIQRKLWMFWLTQFLIGIFLYIISLGLQIIQYLFFIIPTTLINQDVINALLFLIGYLFYFGAYAWFYARFLIAEVPLALENNINCFDTIGRSWTLSQGFSWKIVGIITVALLITLPVYILAAIPVWIAIAYAISLYSFGVYGQPSIEAGLTILLGVFAGVLTFIILNILALPFWQALKGVIYYDLRSRREGLGLTLQDSQTTEEF